MLAANCNLCLRDILPKNENSYVVIYYLHPHVIPCKTFVHCTLYILTMKANVVKRVATPVFFSDLVFVKKLSHTDAECHDSE